MPTLEFFAHEILSIHAPREGCDVAQATFNAGVTQFQSTHPVRGATQGNIWTPFMGNYFNPRTP